MNKKLREKLMESLSSVLPVTGIVILLSITITPLDIGTMSMFVVGAVMLVFGMGLFTLGVDMSMLPMGEHMGSHITKSRRLWLVLLLCFVMGTIITVAEPDLAVLAEQVPHIPSMTIIVTVAIGVGVFLACAFIRAIFKFPLKWMLLALYVIVFVVAIFVPKEFLAMSFDSGGVTTGPITVPFIMALGIGMAAVASKGSGDDSFGLVALCSVGPILAVMLLGIFYPSGEGNYAPIILPNVENSRELVMIFVKEIPHFMQEVGVALLPIVVFFAMFQVISLRLPKRELAKLAVGMVYTYFGLVLFLSGVNVAFLPAGNIIGKTIAALPYKWVLIPIGMVIGYFIVKAEPAVHVLNKQVEEITAGSITKKAMMNSLSIGVAVSLGLAMTRVVTGISIWYFVLPGYIIALAMQFFVSPVISAIAFDSGGVASGPMTATFLLPFAIGASEQLGGNVFVDAFGIVAMVAMTPLITIQLMGVFHELKKRKGGKVQVVDDGAETEEVIDL